MKNGKVFIWMQLLGFNRDASDCGVKEYLDRTGFKPDGIVALVYHADFFHQHRGMDEEYVLPPDNCAFVGIPRNIERERQPWTNYDVRRLADKLKENGTNLYASIFGGNLNNAFHREWCSDYPEILCHAFNHRTPGSGPHFVLKRFADGSYYEDFFIDKVCETLTDYGMKGIHLADAFCPSGGDTLYNLDFSTDLVEQFLNHTGIQLPEHVAATMGSDSSESEKIRNDWIYNNKRAQWIAFRAWRWEMFFTKLCSRLHAIDKEVLALGMYCTDPFETLYCLGIDLAGIVRAGVDYITANILPVSTYIAGKVGRPYRFHKYMAIASTTAAHIEKGHLVSMLALQDATEEWNAMHDAPTLHQRDLYSMMAYQMVDKDGSARALDGYFLCLGDGISSDDWKWERERLEIGLSADAEQCVSPAMLWSKHAFDAMLEEYINTRRWTPHKLFYELGIAGANCAATVKPEGLHHYHGTLVVPNFDMLAEDEKAAIAVYNRGSVLCTASPDFDPSAYHIQPDILFCDRFSDYAMTVFAFNCNVSDALRTQIDALLAVDDGTRNLQGDVRFVEEPRYTLVDTLTFAKVTEGLRKAMALLLNEISDSPFRCDVPNIVLKLKNGAYRLYLYNEVHEKYQRAFVSANSEIADVKIVSKFPILPPRFVDNATDNFVHLYTGDEIVKRSFEVKMQPGGVTIVDVYLKNE